MITGRSVIITYSVTSDGYIATGRDTVKLTMKAIGSEQIYNFKKPFIITDYSTYQVCIDLISKSLKSAFKMLGLIRISDAIRVFNLLSSTKP